MSTDLFEVIFALLFLVVGPFLEYWARRRRLQQMQAEEAESPLSPTATQPVVVEPRLLQPRVPSTEAIRPAKRAALAPHLERFVENLYAPFVEFFDTYQVDLHAPLVAELRPSVAKRVHTNPARWASLAYDAGTTIYRAVPGLRQQAQHATLYGAQAPEPELVDGLDDLFADMLATLWLGPAYTTALLTQASEHADRPFPPGSTPIQLRFMASAKVLHEIGRHREAKQLRTRLDKQQPLAIDSELSGDRPPTPVENLVQYLLLYPFPALAEHTLLDIPGLAYTHATHSHVMHAMEQLSKGSAVKFAPREIVAAAILALDGDPMQREQLVEWSKQSILQKSELNVLRPRPVAPLRVNTLRASCRRALADPHELAKVMAVGAFFPRPHDIRQLMRRRD